MNALRRLALLVAVISGTCHFILMAVLFVFTEKFGGTAHLGKIEGGNYFVGQHGG